MINKYWQSGVEYGSGISNNLDYQLGYIYMYIASTWTVDYSVGQRLHSSRQPLCRIEEGYSSMVHTVADH